MATPDFQSPTATRAFSRVNSTPRPTPNFFAENSFSHRRRTPFRAPRPPRPPTKSCPPVSRIFKTSGKGSFAHTVSFLTSGNPIVESPLYKTDSQQLYFEQCFEIRQKLGEGSFGEVYEVWSFIDGHTHAPMAPHACWHVSCVQTLHAQALVCFVTTSTTALLNTFYCFPFCMLYNFVV